MKHFLTLLALLILFSCKEKFSCFNGEIVFVDAPSFCDTLKGEQVMLDGIYTGTVEVYDSLMFFIISNYPDYWTLVFNIKTGEHINTILRKGNGPGDFLGSIFFGQFINAPNLCVWIHDWGRDRCVLVDLTNSSQKKTVKLFDLKNERMNQMTWVYFLNDSLLLTYNQGEKLFDSDTEFSPPVYSVFNCNTKKELHRYEIYNGFSYSEHTNPTDCLAGNFTMKPDRTKLVIAMQNLHQVNILDLKNGKVKGYRLKGSPDFDILKKGGSKLKSYYTWIYADDELIYAVFQKRKNIVIDVFDWDGNLKQGLFLGKTTQSITLDPINKYLYALVNGEEDEEVYRYDVSYLYK
jgi:WD40 repeat protein